MTLDDFLNDFYSKDLTESIEKHETLNPKLFTEDKLNSEVIDKINQIVDVFLEDLAEDEIKIKVKDIILVGSNVSYNYTKDSDLDIHIIADTSKLKCPDNLYPLLYSAYKSLFNKKLDIDFYGIPVEVYVETDDTVLHSNGIYSVKHKSWIKHPSEEEIPEIDQAAVDKLLAPFEDRYKKVLKKPNIEAIDALITDIYDLRKKGMSKKAAEYSNENLCFKEFRNKEYLDKLKELRNKELSKELSLESLHRPIKESNGRNYLTSSEIYAHRQLLERAVHTQVLVFNNGHFTINNIKEQDVERLLKILYNIKEVAEAHKIASGKYDFARMNFATNLPARYFTINGKLAIE